MNKSSPSSETVPFEFSWQGISEPTIAAKGFREYDGRWLYPTELNMLGAELLGMGLGTMMYERNVKPKIVVGCDFRSYSQSVSYALIIGLIRAGIKVLNIGIVTSPIAYFSRTLFGIDSVAMVTASHNPNGWTGIKAGFRHPLTLNELEMKHLKDIVLHQLFVERPNGNCTQVNDISTKYIGDFKPVSNQLGLKVVCATGNGTAGQYYPTLLEKLGIKVIPLHTEPDCRFPNYNPNPESIKMLESLSAKVCETDADMGFAFDGDGDRLGVVDDLGRIVYSDKVGLLLARSIVRHIPKAKFIVDIKSTGLFTTDPQLLKKGVETEYWKTGHSHIKQRLHETGAIAAFEKSGHFYFNPPIGNGYDDPLVAICELCKLLNETTKISLSKHVDALPKSWITPTLSPYCHDDEKYQTVDRICDKLNAMLQRGCSLGGQKIVEILQINGVRCRLTNGSWALVRASSNTPSLVVVCESMNSEAEMQAIFDDLNSLIQKEHTVGEYDQQI